MASKRSFSGPDSEASAPKRGCLQPEATTPVPGPLWGDGTAPITAVQLGPSAPTAELQLPPTEGPGPSSFCSKHFAAGPASSGFDTEDMEMMRCSPGAEDIRSLDNTANWRFSQQQAVSNPPNIAPSTEDHSFGTPAASFSSTVMDDEVEIYYEAPPAMSAGEPSAGPREAARMASIPLPVLPDEFPDCCLGIYWEMQKKELRRGGGYFM